MLVSDTASLMLELSNSCATLVKDCYPHELCLKAHEYVLNNEDSIIDRFSSNKRGLVVEPGPGNKPLIKYFDAPLSINPDLFCQFLSTQTFELASYILGSSVWLRSFELHSRNPGASGIPPHQDNAYFGLVNGHAVTFYVSLTDQSYLTGGLDYRRIKPNVELEHTSSSSAAFSLTLKNPAISRRHLPLEFVYRPGDTSLHLAHSLHFAEPVPINVERAMAVRLAFVSSLDKRKPGHDAWYANLVRLHRSKPTL